MTVSTSKEPARIASMFDAIAIRYDTLNHLLSAGMDRRWRRRAIRAIGAAHGGWLVDVCTGTADLAIEAARIRPDAWQVVGVDFAGEMLRLGRGKIVHSGLADRVRLVRGDAMRLPMADGQAGAATIAFGIRNVVDPAAAAGECRRVLRPGGRLAILEFGSPQLPVLRQLYGWYFRRVLPAIGRRLSRHRDAYDYLPASVARFPAPADFAALLARAGFSDVRYVPLTFGVVYLYTAQRP